MLSYNSYTQIQIANLSGILSWHSKDTQDAYWGINRS